MCAGRIFSATSRSSETLPRPVNRAHAAGTELFEHLVVADDFVDGCGLGEDRATAGRRGHQLRRILFGRRLGRIVFLGHSP